MKFRTDDAGVITYFEGVVGFQLDYIDSAYGKVRATRTGDPNSKKGIVFVHGTPGSGDAFFGYLKNSRYQYNHQIITYDRPGYGYSSFGKSLPSLEAQASVIEKLIHHYQLESVVVVGHSFGGPIAAVSALHSKKIKGLLLLAPALDPQQEKNVQIAGVLQYQMIRWFTPKVWEVAADEKYTHIGELETYRPAWQSLQIPIIHLHAPKDRLVPFENLDFATEHFNNNYFKAEEVPDGDHFLPWTNKPVVLEAIDKLLRTQVSNL
ncbi:MAG: alpha/beta hydrolase [Flavobacteriaceae bacterium]|nr:alpha/beta hydrolase [Flavobacteriaceae bacterium]